MCRLDEIRYSVKPTIERGVGNKMAATIGGGAMKRVVVLVSLTKVRWRDGLISISACHNHSDIKKVFTEV